MSEDRFIEDEARGRYEYHSGGGVTYARYRREDGVLYIDYVEAPPELRGKGTAGRLMEYIVQ